MTILPVDYHNGHKVGPIVFILGRIFPSIRTCHREEDRLKSEIQNGHQEAFIRLIFTAKITHLPLHHHGDYRKSLIVFILSGHICSGFCKHGWILLQFGKIELKIHKNLYIFYMLLF